MQISINDDLINQAIQQTGLDAKAVLEKALKLLLEQQSPQQKLKFPDLSEFRSKIPVNQSSAADLISTLRDNERY